MNTKLKQLALLFLSFSLILSVGCGKNDLDGYNYIVERSSSSPDLIFYEYLSYIYGFDTKKNTVEVVISIENMELGGVTKLPSGGIAFTSRGNTNNHLGSGKLYITDKQYNVIKTVGICGAPIDPKVIGNNLLIGNSYIPSDLVIVDLDNYKIRKAFIAYDMVEGVRISNNNNTAFFGTAKHFNDGYIVQLNMETLDTTVYTDGSDFFDDGFDTYPTDSLLYIFGVVKHRLYVYNYLDKSFKMRINFDDYTEFASLNPRNIFSPIVRGNYIYGFGIISAYPKNIIYFMKFNLLTKSFEYIKVVNVVNGYFFNPDKKLIGDKLYLKIDKNMVIIDYLTGTVLETIYIH